MLSFLIAVAVAFPVWYVTGRDLGAGWGIVCGIAAFMAVQLLVALVIRRKVMAVNRELEEIMLDAQKKINRQLTLFQQRPGGNLRMMRQTIEKMQQDAVRRTLEETSRFDRFYKWNGMLRRQINTMKMQLHFQLREFDRVDALLPKCFLADARSRIIRLVRMYRKEDPKLDDFYRRKCSRLKGDDGALAALTYAWMKLKAGDKKQALAALVAAKKLSDNPTLIENYERLVNGKEKHFSNANLGDVWYSLYLEEPKIKVQQQRPQGRMF